MQQGFNLLKVSEFIKCNNPPSENTSNQGYPEKYFRGTPKSNATVFCAAKEDLDNPGDVPVGLFFESFVFIMHDTTKLLMPSGKNSTAVKFPLERNFSSTWL